MNKETMEIYARLEEQKKDIEAQQSEIKEKALVFIKDSGADKIESDFGAFKVVARKTYKFSAKVEELETAVETQKETEKKDGTASVEIKESLTFYPVKK